jgi:hypothetical protein
MMGFFDQYDLFLRTSPVGNWPERLNARHEAIIETNRDIFPGARVLDLANHDGRWSFAALKAGAQNVLGVEVRPELVEADNANMAALGVSPDAYRFVAADAFEDPDLFQQPFDVVLCLGFFYHTTRHVELLQLIVQTGASTLILDTMLLNEPGCRSLIKAQNAEAPSAGKDEKGVRNSKILVAHPTAGAVDFMLRHFGYSVERFDWPAAMERRGISPNLSSRQSKRNPLGDYARSERGTFVGTRFS